MREIYSNRWLNVEVHEIVHPGGAFGEHVLVRSAPPSGVVAIDGDDVFFVRQPRFAARETVIEIVKGGRDDGESALDAAKRELLEELGAVAEHWTPLGSAYELPSIIAGEIELFLARGLRWQDARPEETETLTMTRMTMEDAVERALNGELRDAVTVTAVIRAARTLDLLSLP